MTEEEKEIERNAVIWIKQHKQDLILQFADPQEFESDVLPTTVFMAGSPGAGKTEVSKRLVEIKKAVRIDADEIRVLCEGYMGGNAHLFQKAATKGVNMLYDHVMERNLNVVLDGTFAYARALENVGRSIKHDRTTEIVFVYQDPLQAWEFTKKREELEHRRVTKETFLDTFFASQKNVKEVKEKFGDKVELTLIIKDIEHDSKIIEMNIKNIDPYIKKRYSRDELNGLII